jgi:hypothetical protein
MRKVDCLLAMIGAAVVGGACSDSYKPTPSASGVFPAEGFIGRKLEHVEISGEETKWADGATVSFGEGITVSNVVVASESDIFVDLDIDAAGALSDHDVTVTSGKETDTLKAAFRTKSPIDFAIQGQAAQGSVAEFTVTNHDFDNPFDTTSTGDGLFTPIEFPNIQLDGGPGVTLSVSNVTPYSITGLALIDVDAPGTTAPIEVISGPAGGTQVTSPLGASVTIMPRTPTVLAPDTPAAGSIAMPFDSALYTFTPAAYPSLAQLAVDGNGPSGGTDVAVLGESGHFSDLLAAGPSASQVVRSGKLYVITYDLSGDSGYTYQLTGKGLTLNVAADTEPTNNTSANATTLTAAALIDNATLTDDTDQDWFKLAVPMGKKIHVVTMPGDPLTDTMINIYGPNNATTAFGSASSDTDYHEDLTSPTTTVAGTYYIKISASQSGFFDPSHNAYMAIVTLE